MSATFPPPEALAFMEDLEVFLRNRNDSYRVRVYGLALTTAVAMLHAKKPEFTYDDLKRGARELIEQSLEIAISFEEETGVAA